MTGVISEIPGGSKVTEVGLNIGNQIGSVGSKLGSQIESKLDEISDILFKN